MLKVLDHETEDNAESTEGAVATLDEVAREGARRMLMAAMEDEVARYIKAHAAARDENGRRLVVRNGRAQSRTVTCGAGTMQVRAPRVNDRRVDDDGERQRFTSRILPPYMRRSPQVAEVVPLLYLRGLSTGDFREALPVLLGKEAAGLSPTNIARLTGVCRALGAPADVESDRIAVRDGAAAIACDEGGRLPHQGAADGVQAAGDGAAPLGQLNGAHLLPLMRAGVRFIDGLPQPRDETETADRKGAA